MVKKCSCGPNDKWGLGEFIFLSGALHAVSAMLWFLR